MVPKHGAKDEPKGFSLVEVICALAILLMVILPFYRLTTIVAPTAHRYGLQLTANHLAQSEMERIRMQTTFEESLKAYDDDINGTGLFVEARVEELPQEQGYNSFLITIRVFENKTLYQSGEIELIRLKGIRHQR